MEIYFKIYKTFTLIVILLDAFWCIYILTLLSEPDLTEIYLFIQNCQTYQLNAVFFHFSDCFGHYHLFWARLPWARGRS
jgi:hypothetical protein